MKKLMMLGVCILLSALVIPLVVIDNDLIAKAATSAPKFVMAFEDDFSAIDLKEEWHDVFSANAGGDADSGFYWDFGEDEAIVFNRDGTGDAGKLFVGDESWRDYVIDFTFQGTTPNAGLIVRASDTGDLSNIESKGILVNFAVGKLVLGIISNSTPSFTELESQNYPENYDQTAAHDVRVVVIGERIQVYLDSALYIDYNTAYFPYGKIGFRATAYTAETIENPVTFDDLKIYRAQKESVLPEFLLQEEFSDDFESGILSDQYAKIFGATEFVSVGQPSFNDDNKAMQLTGASSGLLMFNFVDGKNYAIELKVRAYAADMAIVARAQNAASASNLSDINGFELRFSHSTSGSKSTTYWQPKPFAYTSSGAVTRAPLSVSDKGYMGSSFLSVKLIVTENYAQVFVDGDATPLYSGFVNTFSGGGIGLRYSPITGRNASVWVDDIKYSSVLNVRDYDLANQNIECSKTILVSDLVSPDKSKSDNPPQPQWIVSDNGAVMQNGAHVDTVYTEEKYTDIDIEFNIELLGVGDTNAGLLFRADIGDGSGTNPISGYFIGYNASKNIIFGKFERGAYATLCYAILQGHAINDTMIRVKTDNAKIEIYINGTLKMQWYDTSLSTGHIGMRAILNRTGYPDIRFNFSKLNMSTDNRSAPLSYELVDAPNPKPSEEKPGGCKSSVSGSIGSIALIAGLGAFILFRRNKNKKTV